MAESYDVVVIGAGPAGLAAAIEAAQQGVNVALLERMAKPGRKLLAAGGGRCNLATAKGQQEFVNAFGRQGKFMLSAMTAYSWEEMMDWFAELGVPLKLIGKAHYFPETEKSTDVLSALLRRIEKLPVQLLTQVEVSEIELLSEGGFRLVTDRFPVMTAMSVVLAAGAPSRPEMGADGTGYTLAQSLGHSLVAPVPALTGVVCRDFCLASCAGVSIDKVSIKIGLPAYRKRVFSGDLLITHKGLSGPAVLDLCGLVARELENADNLPLLVNFGKDRTPGEWEELFAKWQSDKGNQTVKRLLSKEFPRALVNAWLAHAGIPQDRVAAKLPRKSRQKLIEILTALRFEVIGVQRQKAMAMDGGMALKEVNGGTLESRLVPGLYFAGEILDLVGPCGGYNLQWAFTSGRFAGMNAGKTGSA